MGLVSTLLGFVGFGLGIAIGLALGYFFYIYSQPSDVKDPIVRSLHEMDANSLLTLMPEIPSWVKSPDYERVDWLNKFILDMWPYFDKAICNIIQSTMKPIFDEYVGQYWIESIEFDDLSLGSLPPIIHGVKVHETQEKEVVIEPAVRWAGNTNIILVVNFSFFKVTIQLLDLELSLAPRVTLKPLVPSFPCFANLSVSLIEKPRVDFGLKIFGGDIMAIPGLYHLIQDAVATEVSNIYHWPKYLEIPILDGSCGATKKPVGIVHVNVVRAFNLLKMDFIGKSDPYVKISLSGERLPSKKTSIKMRTLNPQWNEEIKLIVKDPQTQVLQLHVYDWEKMKMHDKLGMQVVPLSLLTPNETKEFTLDLLKNLNPSDPHNKRNRGKIVVQLTLVLFKEDNVSFNKILDPNLSGVDRGIEDVPCNGGVLLVTIEGAEDVEGKYHTNPYAVILFRGEKKITQIFRKCRDPKWNEDFQFMLEEPPMDEKIHVEVVSKGRRMSLFHSRESLGFVDINLADVVNNGRINQRYHLINSRNGVVHIEIKWNTI